MAASAALLPNLSIDQSFSIELICFDSTRCHFQIKFLMDPFASLHPLLHRRTCRRFSRGSTTTPSMPCSTVLSSCTPSTLPPSGTSRPSSRHHPIPLLLLLSSFFFIFRLLLAAVKTVPQSAACSSLLTPPPLPPPPRAEVASAQGDDTSDRADLLHARAPLFGNGLCRCATPSSCLLGRPTSCRVVSWSDV